MDKNLMKADQTMETLHEGIWIIDVDANTKFVNPRMAEMLGYTVDEMVGKSVFSFMDEHNEEVAARAIERRKQGIKEQYDLRYLRKDGTPIDVLVGASPVYDDEGNFTGSIGAVLDITERKRLEQALQKSEKRYRELADLLPQIVFETDAQGNFTFTNSRGFQTTGYTIEDFDKGMNASLIFIPEDRERIKKNMQNVMKGEDLGVTEYTALRKDGSKFPVLASCAPIICGGEVTGLRGIVMDFTKFKKMEEALRLQAEITANIADGVFLIGFNDLIIRYANPKIEEMFGYKPDEIIGKHVSILNASTDKHPEETAREIMEIINKIGEWHGEINNIKKDGTPFWSFATVSVFDHHEFGQVLLSILTDITDHKRTENALRESEARFRALAETASDGILSFDNQAIVTFWNQRAETMYGYSSDEIIGKPLTTVIPTRFRASFLEEMKQVDLGADPSVIGSPWETFGLRKDGCEFPIELSMAIWEQNGKTFFTSIVRDITERRTSQ